jgi:tRNA pseudouridine38-40 synthase
MTRYRLDLAYDGTDFGGWQIQPGSRTVQGVVEAALAELVGSPVRVTGAGRTDRGVHAAGQVAHFDYAGSRSATAIARGLTALLPADVQLKALAPAGAGFDARRSATARVYRYTIARRPSPLNRRFAWALGERLDLRALRAASAGLRGEHDFRGFAVADREEETGRCRVVSAEWAIAGGGYRFEIVADRFLTRMVRLLVGALVEVGRGRSAPETVAARLDSPPVNPRPAAAPAAGLCLVRVRYEAASGAGGVDAPTGAERRGDERQR